MKSKIIKYVSLIFIVLVTVSFLGCNFTSSEEEEPKEYVSTGEFVMLQTAYENGYITDRNLAIVHNRYQNNNLQVNITLDDETAEAIKKDWYHRISANLNKDLSIKESDIFIYHYFGIYDDFVVLSLSCGDSVNEIAFEITVGDYVFYSPLDIMVWYPKDKDLTKKSFYDLYSVDKNKLTADNVKKVIIDCAPGSIVPPWVHHVIENSDPEFVDEVLKYLDEVTFRTVNDTYTGVGYKVVTLVTYSGDITFSFSDYGEHYSQGVNYLASSDFPVKQVPGGDYYYIESVLTPVFTTFEQERELDSDFLESIKYQVMIEGPSLYPTYRLTKASRITVGEDSVLIITSANTFYFGNDYCYVIGENDFSSLIDGITDETCKLTVESEEGETVAEFVLSKNTLYTAQEILDKLYRNNAIELRLASGEVFTEDVFSGDFVLTLVTKTN